MTLYDTDVYIQCFCLNKLQEMYCNVLTVGILRYAHCRHTKVYCVY